MALRALCLAALLVWASGAVGDPARVEAAWRNWLAINGAPTSTIAVVQRGRTTLRAGAGARANAPWPVMSVSKTFTGICTMALVRQGRLDLEARLKHLLAGRPDILPPGHRNGRITLAALLTHTSGLRPDATQARFSGLMRADPDDIPDVSRRALRRRPRDNDFFYNNENYALLHLVLEEATGRDVAAYCGKVLFDKATRAGPHPRYGVGLSYAGWQIGAADLARFGAGLRPGKDWPAVATDLDADYGPGIEMWTDRGLIWHFGQLCMPMHADSTTLFYAEPGRFSVVVNVDRCFEGDEIRAFEEMVLKHLWAWKEP